MFYPKIRRLPIYGCCYRKEVLSEDEIKLLFSNEVVIEEKIDGKFMWKEVDNYIIFLEYMRIRHEILYTKLPCYEIAFDVYDKSSKKFLPVPEKHEVLKSCSICYVPVLFIGTIDYNSWEDTLLKIMRRPSYYGAKLMEGIVVKNYRRQLFAKAINREFDEAIKGKEHYIRRKKTEYNKLYKGNEWLKLCYP